MLDDFEITFWKDEINWHAELTHGESFRAVKFPVTPAEQTPIQVMRLALMKFSDQAHEEWARSIFES